MRAIKSTSDAVVALPAADAGSNLRDLASVNPRAIERRLCLRTGKTELTGVAGEAAGAGIPKQGADALIEIPEALSVARARGHPGAHRVKPTLPHRPTAFPFSHVPNKRSARFSGI